jgi:hypothetical protein
MRKQIMESTCPSCDRTVDVDFEMPTSASGGYAIHFRHQQPECERFGAQEYELFREILERGKWDPPNGIGLRSHP